MRVMTDKLPWRPAPDGVEREKGPNICGWGPTGHELMTPEICEISCFTSFMRILSKYHEDKAENSASLFFWGGLLVINLRRWSDSCEQEMMLGVNKVIRKVETSKSFAFPLKKCVKNGFVAKDERSSDEELQQLQARKG